jgi:hypothetical protein
MDGARVNHQIAATGTKGAAILAALLVAVGLCELTVRILGVSEVYLTDALFRPSSYSGVVYEFRPNATGSTWGRTRVDTNDLGLRGPDIALEKGPATYRIGVFGDSVTFGIGVDYEDTYGAVLEKMLRTHVTSNGGTVEVINFGVPAYNITNIVSTFATKGVALDLDLAILAPIPPDYGFDRNHTVDSYGYPVNAETPLRPGHLKNLLRHIHLAYLFRDALSTLRAPGTAQSEPDFAGRVAARAELELRRFVTIAERYGIDTLYCDPGYFFVAQIRRLVEDQGLGYVDASEAVAQYRTEDLVVSTADNHPSPLVHRLVAERLFAVVAPKVERWSTAVGS